MQHLSITPLKGLTVNTMTNPVPADAVFLKNDVKLEPLVCKFLAWPHLISPAQLAMNVTYRLLPLLESFAGNPSVHVAANKDPQMFGGPFVCLTEEDVSAVRAIIEETRVGCKDLIALAEALRGLDATLQGNATGFSLGEYYAQLPEALRGLVEVLYDINSRPNIRIFEDFLYHDDIAAHTHEIMLSPMGEAERTFFMSTPRLGAPDSLSFKMKFSDKRLDALSSMRSTPGSFDAIRKLFDVSEEDLPAFRNFFTTTAPRSAGTQAYAGEGVRIRYFGHACVLVQTDEISILFDPVVALEQKDDGRLTLHDLPEHIDYVVLTHCHQDHLCPEILIQLRHRVGRVLVPSNNSGSIADPSMKLIMRELGFERVDMMNAFDSVALPNGELLSFPFTGEHSDLNIFSKHSILLTLKGRKFMFLVDSDGRDEVLYQRLMRRFGSIDAVFLGMECDGAPLTWLYEPLLTKPINRRNNESRRLSGADSARAWNVMKELNAPKAYVYAMGQEPWMRYLMGLEYTPDSIQLIESNKFLEQCASEGIEAERFFGSREMLFDAA
jgi:L-ascorbate metabolism protein UlaG (beta-lactamase superfamily)